MYLPPALGRSQFHLRRAKSAVDKILRASVSELSLILLLSDVEITNLQIKISHYLPFILSVIVAQRRDNGPMTNLSRRYLNIMKGFKVDLRERKPLL
jgi:hypothetical protein